MGFGSALPEMSECPSCKGVKTYSLRLRMDIRIAMQCSMNGSLEAAVRTFFTVRAL
jgi:hypothetical protein